MISVPDRWWVLSIFEDFGPIGEELADIMARLLARNRLGMRQVMITWRDLAADWSKR